MSPHWKRGEIANPFFGFYFQFYQSNVETVNYVGIYIEGTPCDFLCSFIIQHELVKLLKSHKYLKTWRIWAKWRVGRRVKNQIFIILSPNILTPWWYFTADQRFQHYIWSPTTTWSYYRFMALTPCPRPGRCSGGVVSPEAAKAGPALLPPPGDSGWGKRWRRREGADGDGPGSRGVCSAKNTLCHSALSDALRGCRVENTQQKEKKNPAAA